MGENEQKKKYRKVRFTPLKNFLGQNFCCFALYSRIDEELLKSKSLNRPSDLSHSSYGFTSRPFTALLWTHCKGLSFSYCDAPNYAQGLSWGRTSAGQIWTIPSLDSKKGWKPGMGEWPPPIQSLIQPDRCFRVLCTNIHRSELSEELWWRWDTCWAQSQVTPTLCVSVLTLLQGWSLYKGQGMGRMPANRKGQALHRDNTPPAVYLAAARMHPSLWTCQHTGQNHGIETPCSADAGHSLFTF